METPSLEPGFTKPFYTHSGMAGLPPRHRSGHVHCGQEWGHPSRPLPLYPSIIVSPTYTTETPTHQSSLVGTILGYWDRTILVTL